MSYRLLMVLALGLSSAACSSEDPPAPVPPAGGTPGQGGSGAGTSGAGGTPSTGGSLGGGGAAPVGGAGGGGGGGGSAGTGGAPPLNTMPTLLSETGLFTDVKAQTLAPGVYAYEPQYTLWSDTAAKRRWVYLPPGTKITTDGTYGADFWEFPTGFKLWKEFSRDGVLVETRLLLKKGAGNSNWYMVAFKWDADHAEARAVPDGEMNAMGTQHDIPGTNGCKGCHGQMPDNVLGFTALQLSHNIPGSLNLTQINDMGWLTAAPPAGGYALPGTAEDKAALGYLHANCGICHNSLGSVFNTKAGLDLWVHLDEIAAGSDVKKTSTYLSMLCDQWPGPNGDADKFDPITECGAGHFTGAKMANVEISHPKRIVPKTPAMSSIRDLMALRANGVDTKQMPPLGTEMADPTGLATIDAWINSLPDN